MSIQSQEIEAAERALAVADSTTYPSSVAANQIRKVLRDLLAEHKRLGILYGATCATYSREHEAHQSER